MSGEATSAHVPAHGGLGVLEYQARPNHGEMTEPQKRLLSWQFAIASGKHSYEGTVSRATVAKRRKANRAARQARKAGRA